MEQSVPLIYTREVPNPPISIWSRLVALALGAGALAMLATGAYLTPPAGGISTHTQLGLQPCQFEQRTGLPCPSCGYTTAVTQFVHGNLIASFYLQPMGFVIAIIACVTVWAGFYVAFTGRPVYRFLALINGRKWMLIFLGVALGGWAWKIYIHLTGLDHWP